MNLEPGWGFLPVPYGHYGGLPTPSYAQCPGCGMFWAELAGSTTVGCPLCYETFPQLLSPTIWEQQGGTVHHGKTPPLPQRQTVSRVTMYKEAIVKAQSEGRTQDAQVFIDLLRLLQRDDG